jgi:thioesterase domain-containing protein
MELTNWRQLSDGGHDLVLCLDFPGGRAAASFADLAAGGPAGACFLHLRQASDGPLAVRVDRWVAEVIATGRPVRAVLGYCAGAMLATRVADAIAATGPPPMVVLFDAVPTTGESLASELTSALESSAGHLTTAELADARHLAEHLAAAYPGDLRRIAAGLTGRYDQLMRTVAGRLGLRELFVKELTSGFTAYVDYLLLAGEGGPDMRSATPLFLTSAGYEPPVAGARAIALDIGHDDLLRAPEVHELVAGLLKGVRPW